MTRIDLEHLEHTAMAATQGADQWSYEGSWNNGGMPLVDLKIPGQNDPGVDGGTIEVLLCDAMHIVANRPSTTIALTSYIRELQAALVKAAEFTESTLSTGSEYDCIEDDPDYKAAQIWRELVCRGPVTT